MLLLAFSLPETALGQRSLGYVVNAEVTPTGELIPGVGRIILGGSNALKTLEAPARVVLERGGTLTVCQKSNVRLQIDQGTRSKVDPIHLSIDRGALEILTLSTLNDSITTPRVQVSTYAQRDQTEVIHLALQVRGDGETCVENRSGRSDLTVTDISGHTQFRLVPGHHAIFGTGAVREGSSIDTPSCGCSAVASEGTSRSGATELRSTAGAASDDKGSAFPFPSAESASGSQLLEPRPTVLDESGITVAGVLEYEAVEELDAGSVKLPSQQPGGLQTSPPPRNLPSQETTASPTLGSTPAKAKGFFQKLKHFLGLKSN